MGSSLSKFCVYIIVAFDFMKETLLKIEFLIIKTFAPKIVDHVAGFVSNPSLLHSPSIPSSNLTTGPDFDNLYLTLFLHGHV